MGLETDIERFGQEVETALSVFYAYQFASELLAQDTSRFYQNPHFWMIFLGSVQRTLFISLGRLYDPSNDAFTFQRFIKRCRANIEEFGREYVERRKLESLRGQREPGRPEWLDDFLNKVCYAKIEDLDRLARLARPFNRRMKEVYVEIRSKVFAHAILNDETVASILGQANLKEIEDALTALWSIYEQISYLAYNGTDNLTFEARPYRYKDRVQEAVIMALGIK
jgi:hypothetical protein